MDHQGAVEIIGLILTLENMTMRRGMVQGTLVSRTYLNITVSLERNDYVV